MAKYIFQTKTCLKSEIYANLKAIMIAAGWQNITSLAGSDGDVMYSTGEDTTLALYINMRSTNTTGANDTELTDYNIMSYRFPESYVPGDVGVSGTFGRAVAQEAWKNLYIAPTTTAISKSVTVTIKYHCNKNRLIFAIIYPDASGILPILSYIGIPDEIYVATSGSRDIIFASTAGAATAGTLNISNAVLSMPSDAATTTRSTYVQLSPKQVNSDGKVIMSELFYGNPSEGLRGKLTGIFGLSQTTPVINSGNIVTIGSDQFLVLLCGTVNYNSFQTLYMAIQVA